MRAGVTARPSGNRSPYSRHHPGAEVTDTGSRSAGNNESPKIGYITGEKELTGPVACPGRWDEQGRRDSAVSMISPFLDAGISPRTPVFVEYVAPDVNLPCGFSLFPPVPKHTPGPLGFVVRRGSTGGSRSCGYKVRSLFPNVTRVGGDKSHNLPHPPRAADAAPINTPEKGSMTPVVV